MTRTRVTQYQIQGSKEVNDTLPLGYSDVATLEQDLNYLRSIIRNLKGTDNYDSPLVKNLEELSDILSEVSFENAVLTGNSVSETPPLEDTSTRIATTAFVKSVFAGSGTADKYLEISKGDATLLEWTVTHGMGKKPSVTFEGSDGRTREIGVEYLDNNTVKLTFAKKTSGKAIFN